MTKRLEELDCLRGLAAFSVLLSHFIATFPAYAGWFRPFVNSPLHLFWAGPQAVIFFFVLSGYVLSLPFLADKAPPYPAYLAKRILRIYPPYLCAVALAMGLREILYAGPVPGVGDWFASSWASPVTWETAKNHAILIGRSFPNGDFDPVIWSLIHEMRISLIFPVLAYLVCRREKTAMALGLGVTLFCGAWFYLEQRGGTTAPYGLRTVQYLGTFILGALLAKHSAMLVRHFFALPQGVKWVWLGGAVLFYTNAFWLPDLVFRGCPAAAGVVGLPIVGESFCAVGVSIFIVASLSAKKLSSFLTLPPLRFLGAISYSLYLYHAICLKAAVTLWHPRLPLPAILGIALAASFLIATLSYRFIEMPFMNLGKWIAGKFPRKPGPAGAAVPQSRA